MFYQGIIYPIIIFTTTSIIFCLILLFIDRKRHKTRINENPIKFDELMKIKELTD